MTPNINQDKQSTALRTPAPWLVVPWLCQVSVWQIWNKVLSNIFVLHQKDSLWDKPCLWWCSNPYLHFIPEQIQTCNANVTDNIQTAPLPPFQQNNTTINKWTNQTCCLTVYAIIHNTKDYTTHTPDNLWNHNKGEFEWNQINTYKEETEKVARKKTHKSRPSFSQNSHIAYNKTSTGNAHYRKCIYNIHIPVQYLQEKQQLRLTSSQH